MKNDNQSETIQLKENLINDDDDEPKLEKRSVTGETCFCTYSGIQKQAAKYFKTDEQTILWFPNSFLITYCVGSYFSAFFITRNFKYSYYAATFCNGFGGWVRYIAGDRFAIAILGQILIGIGQNFGCPALIQKWFSKKEKFAALCIASQSIFIGMGIGYILSPAIVGNDPDKIKELNLIVSILLTIPFIICIFVIKEAPDNPPSKIAKYLALVPKVSMITYFTNLLKLFLNWKFDLFLLIFGLSLSNCYTFLSDIDYFLNPVEFSPVKVGAIGLIYVAGGSLADLIFSILIYKNRKATYQLFNFCLKGLQLIIISSLIIFCIFIEKMQFDTVSIVAALLGVGFQGMVPFGLEILSEIGHKDSSLISNSYIFIASLVSVGESELVSMPSLGFYGSYFFIGFQVPALIVLLFYYSQSIKKIEQSTQITLQD